MRIALLGQSLIEHPLHLGNWPGLEEIAAALSQSDICISNLETVIKGPRAGAPTRELLTLHAAAPEVLDTLKAAHINLLATSNNHAFDLGTGGILDTIQTLQEAQLAFAGTGLNINEASAPTFVEAKNATVGLIAFATGKIRSGGAATASRPGVNELRRSQSGTLNNDDKVRILSAIRIARKTADIVAAYHHNHDWEPEQERVPAWQKLFARECIDAGASLFFGHGVPQLQGIEVYKGCPILYGLGNFIFQTEKPVGAYGAESWEGVIAQCEFNGNKCQSVALTPLSLNEVGLNGTSDMKTRGAPRIAKGPNAQATMHRITRLSRDFNTTLAILNDGQQARLTI